MAVVVAEAEAEAEAEDQAEVRVVTIHTIVQCLLQLQLCIFFLFRIFDFPQLCSQT